MATDVAPEIRTRAILLYAAQSFGRQPEETNSVEAEAI